ncbi:hypothetical protein LCGC14_0425430 [marine sediment metagenome]|uniref:J domain-containing protein n=1 Tax=marine sediment metagenome TaxID=412755 RepID=A0A0F9VBL9_9ZZZZ
MRRRHKSKFDYYHELGVEETASKQQIKFAYRVLAKQFHPDKNISSDGVKGKKSQEEAAARFKRISEAYEVLSDPVMHKLYDSYEHPAVRVAPKQGDTNTDGAEKKIPRRSLFVDFITNPDNVVDRDIIDKDGKVKFTGIKNERIKLESSKDVRRY